MGLHQLAEKHGYKMLPTGEIFGGILGAGLLDKPFKL